jgi:CheY-like chemotaxis protein
MVNDGEETLAAWRRGGFDAILMDIQMPNMDGMEATRLIRQEEAGTGKHIPIIAITAHSQSCDLEGALAAGMDGFVSKPIQGERMLREIARCCGLAALTEKPYRFGLPFDEEELLARMAGDHNLLRELAEIFVATTPAMLASLRAHLERADADALRKSAHALKGAISNFCCPAAYELAGEIEASAACGNLKPMAELIDRLSENLQALQAALKKFATPPDAADQPPASAQAATANHA